jgi:hypothetical protein
MQDEALTGANIDLAGFHNVAAACENLSEPFRQAWPVKYAGGIRVYPRAGTPSPTVGVEKYHLLGCLEASPGIEPGCKDLQSSA